MRMKKLIVISLLVAAGFGPAFAGEVFKDSFDGPDGSGINENPATRQSGSAAPLVYELYANKTEKSADIQGGKIRLGVDGNGTLRLVPGLNLAEAGLGEGFVISYEVNMGLDYREKIHGSYLSSIVLAPKSIVKSPIGIGNPAVPLGISISGSGRVNVFSGGKELLHQIPVTTMHVGTTNAVRLVVSPSGFKSGKEASFVLYVNNAEVCKSAFEWKKSDDVWVGLQADNYSASFDNLLIQ